MSTGAGRQLAAQHSHSLECWYAHVPGLRVLAPATVADARGMLLAALRCEDPVILFEHALLLAQEEEVDGEPVPVDLAHAAVRRPGTDLSLITYGGSLPRCLAAAERLATEGIAAEVLDLRVLRPLDVPAIAASALRTRRVLAVDEGWRTGSLAAEVMALVAEQCFFELDAPPARLCSEEVPMPYAKHLEDAALPNVDRIVAASHALMGRPS
jgi:pyruvate dehydrogenase E1 component beta subunit